MIASIRVALVAAALGVVGVVACGDPTGLQATFPTATDPLQLYTLNGAPSGAPNAVYLYGNQVVGTTAVRATPSFGFDIAFDLTSDGRIQLIPVRKVASTIANAPQVGMQVVSGSFDALTKAPSSGYKFDSTLTVNVGQVVAIEASVPAACTYSLNGTNVYGKLVVDSIRRTEGRLFARLTTDPNCGYRSFAPGTPKD